MSEPKYIFHKTRKVRKWQLDFFFCTQFVVISVLTKINEENLERIYRKIGKGSKKEVIVGFLFDTTPNLDKFLKVQLQCGI